MYQQSAFWRQALGSIATRLYSPIVVATLVLPAASIAGGIELDSREYKLMLMPEKFTGMEPQQAIQGFTREQLVPAVRRQWSGDAADELVAKGLKVGERRIVRFFDSLDCLLYRHGFAWRERVDTDKNGVRDKEVELTLKFRSPDAFLAAGMPLKAKDDARKVDSKFEEDLGPIAVREGPQGGVVANPRGARSQFSRSTKQLVQDDKLPTSLAGISGLYHSFEDELQTAAGPVQMSAPLEPSPEYREVVYESSKLDVIKDFKARFALTLWYKGAEDPDQPALAEISFKYDTRNGEVPNEAARRALNLLLKMQDLPWANPAAPTKTALVSCDAAT